MAIKRPRGWERRDAGATPDGRDHWPNDYTVVLAGGGIQPGAVGVPQTVWPPIPYETA